MIIHWHKKWTTFPNFPSPKNIQKQQILQVFTPQKNGVFFPNLLWWFSHEQNWGEKLLERQLLELSWVSGKNWAWAPVGENRGDESRIPNLFCPGRKWQVFSNGWFFDRLVFFESGPPWGGGFWKKISTKHCDLQCFMHLKGLKRWWNANFLFLNPGRLWQNMHRHQRNQKKTKHDLHKNLHRHQKKTK